MLLNKRVNRKKADKCFIWLIWILILFLILSVYIKMMVPNHIGYIKNNPYTIDSVWDAFDNNWHNDILLYTLFQNKPVRIHPDSWYFDYVSAFSAYIILDDTVDAQVDSKQIELSEYTYLNHMLVAAHDTLFDGQAKAVMTSQTSEGAADLYIDEDSIATEEEIMVFHDELGNLYLRGYSNE